jgi:glycosyltransferase involved in cell wall biosynthesis
MTDSPLVSIIINNYNYGRFLAAAIDSALAQTYRRVEVIVVDDGSTDQSRDVIAGYAGKVLPILKGNGGQASAFNAGFAASGGEVIIFLDSDDVLGPTAAEKSVEAFDDPGVVKVHWNLRVMDEGGVPTGKLHLSGELPEGDLREFVARKGPWNYVTPPTSGNAWARRALEEILPVPEQEYRIGADCYLFTLAPVLGKMRRVAEPQGWYRVHGKNHYAGSRFAEKLRCDTRLYAQNCAALSTRLAALGVEADVRGWNRGAWVEELNRAVSDIEQCVAPGWAFILVDEDQWGVGGDLAGRAVFPFMEKDGIYWGPPADDATAIHELERLRGRGAAAIVFARPAFWWLEHYRGWRGYLRENFPCRLENERLVVFDLRG